MFGVGPYLSRYFGSEAEPERFLKDSPCSKRLTAELARKIPDDVPCPFLYPIYIIYPFLANLLEHTPNPDIDGNPSVRRPVITTAP